MVADDIVEMIKTTVPGEVDPEAAATIFAHMPRICRAFLRTPTSGVSSWSAR